MAQCLRKTIQGTLKLVTTLEEKLTSYNADNLANDEIRKLEIMTTTLNDTYNNNFNCSVIVFYLVANFAERAPFP